MLKHIKILKILRHVSTLTDHHQGVGLYLVKVTEQFKNLKNTEFKILMINPSVVTAIHVAGVRGEPCGAVRWTSPTHCTTYTCYMYCCHNTGIDRENFKFSVF